jgi:glycosyltransferase involved in cell wall biosynthesis
MRILQLCHKPPKPTVDGGCIATNMISEGLLKNGFELTILTLSTHKHPFLKEAFSEDFIEKTSIKAVFVDTKLNVVDAFSSLVTSDSYNVNRFFSTDFDILLRKTFQEKEFDVIHLESLFMTTYCHTIRRYSKAKIVLRSHNLEYMIWDRLAQKSTNAAKRSYLKLLAKQLKKYEISIFNSIDGIAAITNSDANNYKELGCTKPMKTIPFGINVNDYLNYKGNQPTSNLSCFHLGAMDWQPNIEGVKWFVKDIWSKIIQEQPNLKLHLGGRKMPDLIIENYKNIPSIINHGEVSSSNDFINQHDVMIVPLLSGGGMRIKIIEGMALGKVVISTKIGAEGIHYENRKNILIANTFQEFLDQLNWLVEDPTRYEFLSGNAKKLVFEEYDNDKIINNLIQFYESLT